MHSMSKRVSREGTSPAQTGTSGWSNGATVYLDTLSVTNAAIHIVEGVYSQDGDGFGSGPHEKVGPANVTSRDYMSNVCLFGTDTFRVDDSTPAIRQIGRDSRNGVVIEMTLPKHEDVYVDVLNNKGEVVWRLMAEDLEPGVHQVVWDGFASPGLYSVYVKGMGWDAVNEVVTYS